MGNAIIQGLFDEHLNAVLFQMRFFDGVSGNVFEVFIDERFNTVIFRTRFFKCVLNIKFGDYFSEKHFDAVFLEWKFCRNY